MKKVKIKAVTEHEAVAEVQSLVDRSGLKEYQLERMWTQALEKTISVDGISPDDPTYYNFVLAKFKTILVDKIGDTMGYGMKKLLEIGDNTLPYI